MDPYRHPHVMPIITHGDLILRQEQRRYGHGGWIGPGFDTHIYIGAFGMDKGSIKFGVLEP